MSDKTPPIQLIRQEIDNLDIEIQNLISRRAQCAVKMAQIKQRSDTCFYQPDREAEVLGKVKQRNQGPLSDESMVGLFRQIMSDSLALQTPLKIAYLGPEGTFTHEAALKQFSQSASLCALKSIDAVFREVEADSADYGVVPVENSTEGAVNHTLDLFMHSPLTICGEMALSIHHCLATTVTQYRDVHCVYGHQQALAQCRSWLNTHLPNAKQMAMISSAEAAKMAKETSNAAATVSPVAARLYQLDILAHHIEDDPANTTRFIVIGKQAVAANGQDKTSLLLSAPNQPGALYQMLLPIAENQISMTRIESRPSRRTAWDYVFFVDIEGHQSDIKVAKVLSILKKQGFLLRVLGSYPVDQ